MCMHSLAKIVLCEPIPLCKTVGGGISRPGKFFFSCNRATHAQTRRNDLLTKYVLALMDNRSKNIILPSAPTTSHVDWQCTERSVGIFFSHIQRT